MSTLTSLSISMFFRADCKLCSTTLLDLCVDCDDSFSEIHEVPRNYVEEIKTSYNVLNFANFMEFAPGVITSQNPFKVSNNKYVPRLQSVIIFSLKKRYRGCGAVSEGSHWCRTTDGFFAWDHCTPAWHVTQNSTGARRTIDGCTCLKSWCFEGEHGCAFDPGSGGLGGSGAGRPNLRGLDLGCIESDVCK